MKVIYLTYDGLTDPLGQSQILPYLLGLSKSGTEIFIISAEKKTNYKNRKSLILSIIQANPMIHWEPIFYTKKPPVLSTVYDLYKMEKKATLLINKHTISAIHCRSYISALIGEKLKKKFGVKFIFDMRGFWADERVEGGLWDLKSKLYKRVYEYFKRKEKDFLEHADYTIALTFNAKKEIESWMKPAKIPIQVIPCCVDVNLFDSEKIKHMYLEKLWQEVNILPEEFVISYLGSLGTWYMAEEMLLLFKALLTIHPDSKFLFITPDNPEIIYEIAQKLGIPNRHFIFRKAERKEIPGLIKLSQISLFFVKPSYSKKASSPTKMGEILSMGVPVICNSGVGDMEYLFDKYDCGILLKDFTEKSYTDAVNQIALAIKIPKESLRKTATSYFDLQKGIASYQEVYDKMRS